MQDQHTSSQVNGGGVAASEKGAGDNFGRRLRAEHPLRRALGGKEAPCRQAG